MSTPKKNSAQWDQTLASAESLQWLQESSQEVLELLKSGNFTPMGSAQDLIDEKKAEEKQSGSDA